MSALVKILLWLVWIAILLGLRIQSTYNGLIGLDESISSVRVQVDNMYERRADLVPQVVAVVKKYADYEWSVLTGIAALRSNATTLQTMVNNGDTQSESFGALLASTMGGMKIISENYPTLKADTQFTNLYTTLEWSENRIRTAIQDYNNAVIEYNTRIRRFPANIAAAMLGFIPRERITPPSDKDIQAVPDVENLLNS